MIVQFSSLSQNQIDTINKMVVDKSGRVERIVPQSLALFYMTDLTVRSRLCISQGTFYPYIPFLDNDGGTRESNQQLAAAGKKLLAKAAANICLTLGPISGIVIGEADLRGDNAVRHFMDRPIRDVPHIAKHRSGVLLQQLAKNNPNMTVYLIEDDGTIVLKSIEQVLEMLKRQTV